MPDATGTVEKVTFNRRFFGNSLLEGVLFLVTLIIGWYVWLFFVAKTSQTPAKRLLNVYTIDLDSGRAVSAGRVWVRDVVIKQLLIGVLNAFLVSIPGIVDAVWILFDKNRQSLHDKVVNTIVVYAPNGLPEAMKAEAISGPMASPTGGGTAASQELLPRQPGEIFCPSCGSLNRGSSGFCGNCGASLS